MIEKQYYYGARYYWPSLGRWLAVDPKLGKYASWSPYVYALNNPLKIIDPDGNDIAFYVQQTERTKQFGHADLYYQDMEGNWYQFNQGDYGVKIQTSQGPPKGALLLRTSSEQDKAISESAIKSQADHDSGETEFNLLTNNCKDAAVDVVNNARSGVTVDNPICTITPAAWFDEQKSAKIDIDPQNQGADATNVIIQVNKYEVVQ